MTNKNFCLSSYIAYRYIYKEGIDFFEGMQHHNFIPINIAERIPVKTAHDIDIEIQKEFDNDTLMHPMSYVRMKELTTYRKPLQEELVEKNKKIGGVYEHECNDCYIG